MARNVEIKARIREYDAVYRRAMELSGGPPRLSEQEDVFFQSARGRLKLRRLADGTGQLIFYDRPDVAGPKTSTYSIRHTDNPAELRSVLSAALDEIAHVKKVRQLFLVGSTRIHLDVVEGLGEFLELEVVLAAEETDEFGEQIALKLVEELGVESPDFVTGA